MSEFKVKTDLQHFNWLKDIQFDVQKMGSMFQNEGITVSGADIKEFNLRYSEVKGQLDAWHKESLKRFEKIGGQINEYFTEK